MRLIRIRCDEFTPAVAVMNELTLKIYLTDEDETTLQLQKMIKFLLCCYLMFSNQAILFNLTWSINDFKIDNL